MIFDLRSSFEFLPKILQQIIVIMNKKLISSLSALLLLSCNSIDTKSLTGNWIEVTPANMKFIQGMTLNTDGTAQSIGMATLLYEKWNVEGDKMILSGKSLGNGQTIEFSDTLNIVKITADSMIFENNNKYKTSYYKVTEIPVAKAEEAAEVDAINVKDSLNISPDLGEVMQRTFEGLLPAASGPGIDYTLVIYNQQNSGDGVYKLKMRYIEAEDGKDAIFTTYGRLYTLRGDATDKNATVYQLVPFTNPEEVVNFLLKPDGNVELINSDLKRAESNLNYTLKLSTDI